MWTETNSPPERRESWLDPRQFDNSWHKFVALCRSLNGDGLGYDVRFNLTSNRPHLLITASVLQAHGRSTKRAPLDGEPERVDAYLASARLSGRNSPVLLPSRERRFPRIGHFEPVRACPLSTRRQSRFEVRFVWLPRWVSRSRPVG
jgi:hypothetical protein